MSFGKDDKDDHDFDPHKKLGEIESRIKHHINGFLHDQINTLVRELTDLKTLVYTHEKTFDVIIKALESQAILVAQQNADVIRLKGIIEGMMRKNWEDVKPATGVDKPKKGGKTSKREGKVSQ